MTPLAIDTPMFVFANGLLLVLGAYLTVGAGFALIFATWGVQRIDPAAKGMPIGARVLILPGAMGLWPLLVMKWLRRQSPPVA